MDTPITRKDLIRSAFGMAVAALAIPIAAALPKRKPLTVRKGQKPFRLFCDDMYVKDAFAGSEEEGWIDRFVLEQPSKGSLLPYYAIRNETVQTERIYGHVRIEPLTRGGRYAGPLPHYPESIAQGKRPKTQKLGAFST